MKWHYLYNTFNSNHKLRIYLVGCGGTGTHVLTNLAMINEGLKHHGRSEIMVTVYDPDTVSEHNIGRQIFSPVDIGKNKADVMVQRINRFYGYGWESVPQPYIDRNDALIIISALDRVQPRKGIDSWFLDNDGKSKYWLDIGNGESDGQVILGAISDNKIHLPGFFNQFGYDIPETPDEPSCSAVESLAKQGLFINKYMATIATNMLWTLLIDFRIHYRGVFANLATLETSPILID
jgi:PRTRC genetic system ThiF family protein